MTYAAPERSTALPGRRDPAWAERRRFLVLLVFAVALGLAWGALF